jgi:tRNA-specific 2-thiouridylase
VTAEPRGQCGARLRFHEPQRRVAAGQSVVLYDGDEVVGGGLVTHVTD